MPERKRGEAVILGILTAVPGGWSRSPVGPQTVSYKALQRAGKSLGVRVLVFRPRDVDWRAHRVVGWIWSARGRRWRKIRSPMPDVVYNRVPRRSLEQAGPFQACTRRLVNRGVTLFNPGFFDKRWVYDVLAGDPRSTGHLPPTSRVHSGGDVLWALEQWHSVFVKPVHGTRGRGLLYLHGGPRRVHFHATGTGRHRTGSMTLRQLMPTLNRLIRRRPYVVQSAVDRARYRQRPFDVRTLVQRGPEGEWLVTGMAGRVAGRGCLATHESQGGFRAPLDPVLRETFPSRVECIRQGLEETALGAAQALQQASSSLLGEMSIDLTLDREGHVWILECNSKPMRFDERGIRHRHHLYLLHYARHLAGRPVLPGARERGVRAAP